MAHAPFASPSQYGPPSITGKLAGPIIMAAGLLGSAGMLAAAIIVLAPQPQGMPAPDYHLETGEADKAVTASAAAMALRGTEHEINDTSTAAAARQAQSAMPTSPDRPLLEPGNGGQQAAAPSTIMPPAGSERTAMLQSTATVPSRSSHAVSRADGSVSAGATMSGNLPASAGTSEVTFAATQQNNETAPVVVTAQRRQLDPPAVNIDRVSRGNTVVIQLPRKS
jgi:hypothetical protein